MSADELSMKAQNTMPENTRMQAEDFTRRAAVLPLKLHREVQGLSAELLKLYEREEKLLNIIDKRDRQVKLLSGGKKLPQVPDASELRAQTESELAKRLLKAERELEAMRSRYEALSNSKLGRAQRWYWKKRARK